MNIIIIGGGIGGLAAAIACARAKHHVLVLERQKEFTELGAGIQLAPNAFHALDYLGVATEVKALAVKINACHLINGLTGKEIIQLRLDTEYQQKFGNPYLVIHRTDLYYPLLQACQKDPLIELRTSSNVTGYTQEDDNVTVYLADGSPITADAAIGADGIRSVIRQQFVGDGAPRISGHTIYRSVIPMDKVPEFLQRKDVNLWAGPKWHFVHYPIAGGNYMNFAITKDDNPAVAVSGEDVPTSKVLQEFSQVNTQIVDLLTLGETWKKWTLCDREPIENWTDGRVTLLGDAAHPMLQYIAQGACMALEDAVVLGKKLTNSTRDNVTVKLREYNMLRYNRTARVTRAAREIGEKVYHAYGEMADERDTLLASLSLSDIHAKISWLHGVRPPYFTHDV